MSEVHSMLIQYLLGLKEPANNIVLIYPLSEQIRPVQELLQHKLIRDDAFFADAGVPVKVNLQSVITSLARNPSLHTNYAVEKLVFDYPPGLPKSSNYVSFGLPIYIVSDGSRGSYSDTQQAQMVAKGYMDGLLTDKSCIERLKYNPDTGLLGHNTYLSSMLLCDFMIWAADRG